MYMYIHCRKSKLQQQLQYRTTVLIDQRVSACRLHQSHHKTHYKQYLNTVVKKQEKSMWSCARNLHPDLLIIYILRTMYILLLLDLWCMVYKCRMRVWNTLHDTNISASMDDLDNKLLCGELRQRGEVCRDVLVKTEQWEKQHNGIYLCACVHSKLLLSASTSHLSTTDMELNTNEWMRSRNAVGRK